MNKEMLRESETVASKIAEMKSASESNAQKLAEALQTIEELALLNNKLSMTEESQKDEIAKFKEDIANLQTQMAEAQQQIAQHVTDAESLTQKLADAETAHAERIASLTAKLEQHKAKISSAQTGNAE